jgi:hypothetical protein
LLKAAYADCVAVVLLTITLGATAWFATRQIGLPVRRSAVPLTALGSLPCIHFDEFDPFGGIDLLLACL